MPVKRELIFKPLIEFSFYSLCKKMLLNGKHFNFHWHIFKRKYLSGFFKELYLEIGTWLEKMLLMALNVILKPFDKCCHNCRNASVFSHSAPPHSCTSFK